VCSAPQAVPGGSGRVQVASSERRLVGSNVRRGAR
jgi:hypothetical protein